MANEENCLPSNEECKKTNYYMYTVTVLPVDLNIPMAQLKICIIIIHVKNTNLTMD